MPSSDTRKHREPPLWAMLLLSAVLLLLAGASLATFQYQQHSKVILDTGDQLFAGISQRVQQSLQNTYHPPIQALNLLALDELADTTELEQRIGHLDKLAQTLTDLPQLNSLYVGWDNGDYLMLRPLRSPALREHFDAPAGTAWMVWHIHDQDGWKQTTHQFLDQQLTLLEQRQPADEGFDPRLRPWYVDARASDGQIITTPYIFFSTSEFGTTLARPAGRNAVIGADLTLSRLSASLTGQGVPPLSELLLYDSQGVVIAYHDVQRILNTAHGNVLRLKRFNELGSTLLAALAQDGYRIERKGTLLLEGQRWIVLQHKLTLQGIPDTYLAILVSEAELLADAYRIRRESVWMSLLISLILLPLLWFAGQYLLRAVHAKD